MSIIQVKTPLPDSYSAPSTSGASASTPSKRRLLPAGPAYLNHLKLTLHHGSSFDKYDEHLEEERAKLAAELKANGNGVEDDLGVGDEPESDETLSLDPKEWKKHDYYAVLGLSHLRYKATPAQIKIAHRKKVLKHHPDKKASSDTQQQQASAVLGIDLNTNDDAFFKCISKAHEVLTNPEKRRQYDSVDHEFVDEQDDVPTAAQLKGKPDEAFIKAFTPVFARESRFSKTQPVPQLGDLEASKEHVEGFYNFWYSFDSWRSFEWLDKEVNEGSDSRDDKRYTEKKNKTERARRKKEDVARVRNLVDLACGLDPRIKRIKQEEKEARLAKKAAKSAPTSGANTPKATKSKAELEAEKAAAEEADKIAKAEAKKAKTAAANAAKKARRAEREAAGAA